MKFIPLTHGCYLRSREIVYSGTLFEWFVCINMEILTSIDQSLLHLVTETLKNGFFDFVMPAISNARLWVLPILVGSVVMMYFGKKKGVFAFFLALLAVDKIIDHS